MQMLISHVNFIPRLSSSFSFIGSFTVCVLGFMVVSFVSIDYHFLKMHLLQLISGLWIHQENSAHRDLVMWLGKRGLMDGR